VEPDDGKNVKVDRIGLDANSIVDNGMDVTDEFFDFHYYVDVYSCDGS
jgi:hypothetical protein